MLEAMDLAILIGAGLIVISVLTSLVSFRVGAPLLLVFLGVGLLAGEDGIGGIDFDNGPAAFFIGSLALAVVLFDSGFETRVSSLRAAAGPALTLATVGVLATTALTAVAAYYLLRLDGVEAMLMGAIVASTDAAAVFFLLRVGGITLRDRVRSTLEIESGSNDPVAIFLTLALVELVRTGATLGGLAFDILATFLVEAGLGVTLGLLGGFVIVQIVNRIELEAGLYPVIVLAAALLVYAATNILHGSGFVAVYVAGIVAGNARLRSGPLLRRFQSGLTWLAQIVMFLTLGLLATPSQFPAVALPAVALALVLTFVARPIAVWLSLLPFGFSRNETSFVAWVGLRGAVSILLAILPVIAGTPNGQAMFNTTFLVVIVSLLLQGWTVKPMARWLGLIVPPRLGPVDRVELELPGRANHELVAYRIHDASPILRGERIPRWARPSLIVRGDQALDIHRAGRLQAGDQVYIFTAPRRVRLLDRLFASPVALAEDDRDFFGDFSLQPDAPLGEIASLYGAAVPPALADRPVGGYLAQAFAGGPEVGDRLPMGPVELIVRSVDEDGAVAEVGLALAPSRGARPKLPLFQSRREIVAALRGWIAAHRARRTRLAAPAAPERHE
jgi:cell volume regulation protein A